MDFNTFKMLLDNQRKLDKFLDTMYGFGIDLIDCEYMNLTTPLIKEIFRLSFSDEDWENAYDWFEWYLYEKPMLGEKTKHRKSGKMGHAWDSDGNPIDVDSDEGLFAFIDKEYKKRE